MQQTNMLQNFLSFILQYLSKSTQTSSFHNYTVLVMSGDHWAQFPYLPIRASTILRDKPPLLQYHPEIKLNMQKRFFKLNNENVSPHKKLPSIYY